ncbi:MAG: GNAT family N-acetyltransferase [Ilumatobacter sp.]|uniref:GNAT family N-acetyltransferase n=1 Tax=Ilumatobacter sp. TaxID=1967498 RepID=UPI003298BFA5
MTPHVEIHEIISARTHDLRRRVLRDGAADAVVDWVGDHDDSTVHLGAVVGGQLVGISTWSAVPDPHATDLPSIQLRGMATDPAFAGQGLGRSLLDAGFGRARSAGPVRVWANARVTALEFYTRAGMVASGPVFVTEATGLPHRHVHIDLS